MSLARLVITAVVLEGRSKSAVARDYGISRFWVHQLVNRFQAEGEVAFQPRSRRPHSSPHAVSLELEDQIVRLRKTLTKKGVDAGAETIAAHLQIAESIRCRRSRRSGGSCPAAGSWSGSRRNGPGHHGRGSAPTSPTNAGRPISPTGGWPTAGRWRS
jgi:transposase-like protein